MVNFALVAVALPIDRVFHYAVPEALAAEAAIGKRVKAPFQNRVEIGYIVGFSEKPELFEVKDIYEVIDKEPIV